MMGDNGKIIKKAMDKAKPSKTQTSQRVFQPETLKSRQNIYNTIRPSDYLDINNYVRYLFNNQREEFDDERSEEAFRLYLGLEDKPKYIRPSKYKPTINADPNGQYYSVDNELEQDIFRSFKDKVKPGQIYPTNEAYVTSDFDQSDPRYFEENGKGFMAPTPGDKNLLLGRPMSSNARMLGNFVVSRGKDQKGEYLSYSDQYDFPETFQEKMQGQPYKIYGRVYYPKREFGGEGFLNSNREPRVSDNTYHKNTVRYTQQELADIKRQNAINKIRPRQSQIQQRSITPESVRKGLYDNREAQEIMADILHGADMATDMMQFGNFIPLPQTQMIGKIGNVLGSYVDAFQRGVDVRNGDYTNAAINTASIAIPKYLGKKGYRRDMYNTNPGSPADRIASMGNRDGDYIHLTPPPHLKNNPVIMKGVNFNRGVLGALGAETFMDSYEQGGEMIRRADGSYSRRGLWDNIRDNIGSGKKPTKEMLKQERKIRAKEMKNGGTNNPGFEALPDYVQAKILSSMGYGGIPYSYMEIGGNNPSKKSKKSSSSIKLNPTQEYYANEMFNKYGKVVMTDKGTNQTYYGTKRPDGTWDLNSFEVLSGKASGKDKQYISNVPVRDLADNPSERITPIGVFGLKKRNDIYGMPGYMLGNTSVAYHKTYEGADDKSRKYLYNNGNAQDNYRSYGCINCEKPNMENLLKFVGDSGVSTVIDSRLSPEENSRWMKKNTPSLGFDYKVPVQGNLPAQQMIPVAKRVPSIEPAAPQVAAQKQVPTQKQVQRAAPVQKQAPVKQTEVQQGPYGPVPREAEFYVPGPMIPTQREQQVPVQKAKVAKPQVANNSIVDFLNNAGIDASKSNRAEIASKLGIDNYDYSAEKNIQLLNMLRDNQDLMNQLRPSKFKNGGSTFSGNAWYKYGGEPDGGMALGQIDGAIEKLQKLRQFITPESDLEPWISSKLTILDDYSSAVADYMMYNPEASEQSEEMPEMEKGGGIPNRYKNMGFTHVGQKKQGDGKHKWKVLAKKGDQYKVVQGGYRGMDDFSQHHSEKRKDRFWDRMGGRNSSKAKDPFSPLYWHKRFGTWEDGGEVYPEMNNGGVPCYECGGMYENGGGIHINPANEGKFTASAKAAGMGVQEFAAHVLANKDDYSSTQVKRANFARNAAKWREDGGELYAMGGYIPYAETGFFNIDPTAFTNQQQADMNADAASVKMPQINVGQTDQNPQKGQTVGINELMDKSFAKQFGDPYSVYNMTRNVTNLIEGLNNRKRMKEMQTKQMNYNSSTGGLFAIKAPGDGSKGFRPVSGTMQNMDIPNRIGGDMSFTGMNQQYYNPFMQFGEVGLSVDSPYAPAETLSEFVPNSFPTQSVVDKDIQENMVTPELPSMDNDASDMDLKEFIAAKESGGRYTALPKDKNGRLVSSAAGKYQFLWNEHKNDIANVTGVKTKEEFLNNPEAQEKFFDYWDKTVLTPYANKLRNAGVNASMQQIKYMIHFAGPKGAQDYFLKGKETVDGFGMSTSKQARRMGISENGGEVEMSADEIMNFLAMGGEVEYMED